MFECLFFESPTSFNLFFFKKKTLTKLTLKFKCNNYLLYTTIYENSLSRLAVLRTNKKTIKIR